MRRFIIGLICAFAASGAVAAPPTGLEGLTKPVVAAPMTAIPGKAIRVAQACCKQCSKGKACGNSCISRDKQCHKGKGCACD